MDSATDATASSASSASAPAGRLPGRLPATSFAGLIDVLDRVDGPAGGPGLRRLQAHRSAAHDMPGPRAAGSRAAGSRAAGFRATGFRGVPLRSVQPAPMARRPAVTPVVQPEPYGDMSRAPAPVATVNSVRKPRTGPTRMAALIRRAAMWGAGSDGEYLAWRTAMTRPAPAQVPVESVSRMSRLRGLVHRMALWGAGDGTNLAWGAPGTRVVTRRLDPPVVLREMPSTPLIQPAASSPAAALVTAGPAPAGRRLVGPVLPRVAPGGPVGWCAPDDSISPAPSGWPAPPTGWPQPPEWPPSKPVVVRSSPPSTCPAARSPFSVPRERGLARARGDPLSFPARGSPPPGRSTPSSLSASIWSPAPESLPPPCPAQAAPG